MVYLLLVFGDEPAGGTLDIAGAFASEEEARAAFDGKSGYAEVVEVGNEPAPFFRLVSETESYARDLERVVWKDRRGVM